jgi:hypothetical protein
MSAVLRFANVAKRSGAAEVYAVACGELDAADLGCLLLHLRRVDPDWRPDIHERRRLAYALLEANVPNARIRTSSRSRRRRSPADAESWSTTRSVLANPHCRAALNGQKRRVGTTGRAARFST